MQILEYKNDICEILNKGSSFFNKNPLLSLEIKSRQRDVTITLGMQGNRSLRKPLSNINLKMKNTKKMKEEKPKIKQVNYSEDILVRLLNKGIISNDNLHSAYKIRRAFQLITCGTQIHVSQYKEHFIKSDFHTQNEESAKEIFLQNLYADWVDEMKNKGRPVGPILDILIDEISLNQTCKKWRKRNGWAKIYLCEALEIYELLYLCKIGQNRK